MASCACRACVRFPAIFIRRTWNNIHTDTHEMDPHEVLAVKPGRFSWEELKANYRHLAERLHPTKCQLPPEEAVAVLRRLTACYKQLKDDLRAREAEAEKAANAAMVDVAGEEVSEASKDIAKNMDMERFNRIFEETRLPDPHSGGHHGWFSREDPEEDEVAHNLCDTEACDEPDAMSCIGSRDLGFSDLGVTSLDNYGNSWRPARSQFTDLRDAHTARHNLMSSRMVQEFREKPMRTVDALKQEREEGAVVRMTPEDHAEQQRLQARKAEQERRRLAAVEENNRLISKQFDRSRALLFGQQQQLQQAKQPPPVTPTTTRRKNNPF